MAAKAARRKAAAAGPHAQLAARSNADKLALWLFQVLLITLSKSLSSVGSLGGRWFAMQLWCGRSTLHLARWLKTLLLHSIAWLWQPSGPRSSWPQRWARAFGVEAIRRVHVLVGEQHSSLLRGPLPGAVWAKGTAVRGTRKGWESLGVVVCIALGSHRAADGCKVCCAVSLLRCARSVCARCRRRSSSSAAPAAALGRCLPAAPCPTPLKKKKSIQRCRPRRLLRYTFGKGEYR